MQLQVLETRNFKMKYGTMISGYISWRPIIKTFLLNTCYLHTMNEQMCPCYLIIFCCLHTSFQMGNSHRFKPFRHFVCSLIKTMFQSRREFKKQACFISSRRDQKPASLVAGLTSSEIVLSTKYWRLCPFHRKIKQ